MREPICCGPRRGLCRCTRRTVVADSDVGDLLPRIVALLDLRGGSDERLMLEFAGSSSRPVVAGVAYRSFLADGASLSSRDERGSSSRSVVADVACRPLLVGGASLLPLGAGVLLPGVCEVVFDDIV
jgi:hypothetical protein